MATASVIALVEERGGGPRERLSTLLLYTSSHPEAPKLEQAMRAWASRDAVVAHALERVDQQRVAFVKDLLVQEGIAASTAQLRSRGLYLALIGEFASVSHGGQPSGAEVWNELIQQSLVRAKPDSSARTRSRAPTRR